LVASTLFAANDRGHTSSEVEDAAFTDISGKLPSHAGVKAINSEIARRLDAFYPQQHSLMVPDQ
jgi:hypothetical protein